MLQLQRNVPPPATRTLAPDDGRKKYPFERMQVGDFFFVPGKTRNTIRTYFSTAGAKHVMKLTSKLIHARLIDEVWSPCEETDEGATLGVGVWRVE